jgi:hypothetical protein
LIFGADGGDSVDDVSESSVTDAVVVSFAISKLDVDIGKLLSLLFPKVLQR